MKESHSFVLALQFTEPEEEKESSINKVEALLEHFKGPHLSVHGDVYDWVWTRIEYEWTDADESTFNKLVDTLEAEFPKSYSLEYSKCDPIKGVQDHLVYGLATVGERIIHYVVPVIKQF